MPIIPWRPFREIDKFFEEDWPGLEWTPEKEAPKMNVYEEKDNVVAEVELPGVDPKNIDIEIQDNVLSVEGKKEQKQEKKEKGYYRRELSKGYYRRSVRLPAKVKEGDTKANYKDGVVKITMPKVEPKSPKAKGTKIKVEEE